MNLISYILLAIVILTALAVMRSLRRGGNKKSCCNGCNASDNCNGCCH